MARKKNKYIKRQRELVAKQKAQNRIEFEKIIDSRRDEVEEILIEKNKDFRKHNLLVKAEDIRKDKGTVGNKTFKTLRSGFINARNKEKYIEVNRDHIKGLSMNHQRNLVLLFFEFL